ncbi:hypothetical protein [Vagococcus fluvialis]|uniref:hypothetical protein n=1 Tax=Vagococcus fluvialis TaxID=2738 RepID=UPI0020343FC2|nr:hypothetical protein [Vagococcus fluvialis]MCM2140253.1 hypothetical protein [Vagococcus fluvialis]
MKTVESFFSVLSSSDSQEIANIGNSNYCFIQRDWSLASLVSNSNADFSRFSVLDAM